MAFERPEAFGVFSAVSTLAAKAEEGKSDEDFVEDFFDDWKTEKTWVERKQDTESSYSLLEVPCPGTVAFALQGHTIIVEILAETRLDL